MAEQKGSSNLPMIIGVMGGVFGMPPAACAGACAVGIGTWGGGSQILLNEIGPFYFYLLIGVFGSILGFVGGLLGKKIPNTGGIMMLIAAFMSGITLIKFNILVLITVILFLLGAIICFVQKREDVLG